jgi:hypothetical protein
MNAQKMKLKRSTEIRKLEEFSNAEIEELKTIQQEVVDHEIYDPLKLKTDCILKNKIEEETSA